MTQMISSGWTIRLARTKIYASSLEDLPVTVYPPFGVSPISSVVQFAFLTTDPPEPQPSTDQWVSGYWSNSIIGPTAYQAECLVGSGGVTVLTAGTYYVWLTVNSAATGEKPVGLAGSLFVI